MINFSFNSHSFLKAQSALEKWTNQQRLGAVISHRNQQGMTLVELSVVLLILVTLATIAIRSTSGLQDQARWEQTKNRFDALKTAIIGDPTLSINGQPDISGFVADMGRLPVNIKELLSQSYCDNDFEETVPGSCGGNWITNTAYVSATSTTPGYGWNGPYLLTSQTSTEADAFSDGWGNTATATTDLAYGWTFDATASPFMDIQSNGCTGCDLAEYNNNYPLVATVIEDNDWLIDISGGITALLTPSYAADHCATQNVSTESACLSAGWSWPGSCSGPELTQLECEMNSGVWTATNSCADSAYLTQAPCESNGKIWGTCSGATNSKSFCESNGAAWFYKTQDICMLITYRTIDGGGGTIITAPAISATKTITENGSQQLVTFDGFSATDIPMGINSIAIYEHDGDCDPATNPLYTANSGIIKQAFIPHKTLPTLNW